MIKRSLKQLLSPLRPTIRARKASPLLAPPAPTACCGFAAAKASLALLLLLLAFAACERRPLELYYDGKAEVRINVDWLSRYHYRPHGMTLMLAKDGDAFTFTDIYSNDQVDGVTLRLLPGEYKLLLFNQTIEEYDSINFYSLRSFDAINAQARISETGDRYSWDENVRYMDQPNRIGVAVDTFTVTQEMVDRGLTFYDYRGHYDTDTLRMTLNEVVRPMTTLLTVKLHVRNLRYMRSVEAQFTGMADGFSMTHIWRREQTGYFKMRNWRMTPDNDSLTSGWLEASVRTFGLPHGRELLSQRDSTSNSILFNFTLINNKTYMVSFNVGKLIRYKGDTSVSKEANARRREQEFIGDTELTIFTTNDVELELELVLDESTLGENGIPDMPYAQPAGTSAFEAVVSDWGEEEDIYVNF